MQLAAQEPAIGGMIVEAVDLIIQSLGRPEQADRGNQLVVGIEIMGKKEGEKGQEDQGAVVQTTPQHCPAVLFGR